jgi:hypothetical protein
MTRQFIQVEGVVGLAGLAGLAGWAAWLGCLGWLAGLAGLAGWLAGLAGLAERLAKHPVDVPNPNKNKVLRIRRFKSIVFFTMV